MRQKLGLILGGSLLIAVFLAWMLLKGTDAVQTWLDTNSLLGFGAWGIAWLCALGGAALIARAVFRGDPDPSSESD